LTKGVLINLRLGKARLPVGYLNIFVIQLASDTMMTKGNLWFAGFPANLDP
tara:strand:+ start:936 stop:1088 length:153 start_codon:yes stop_codon:yes gene_type:complete